MKTLVVLTVLALLCATQLAFAQRVPTFEDAVTMAGNGLIVRGTVLDASTEGKDGPIPRIEPGAQPYLYTTWRVRIDGCYYSAKEDCGSRVGSTIAVAAITGGAIERDGIRHYEPLITNSVTLAVTVPLSRAGSVLLFVRPSTARPGSYEVVPRMNGSQTLESDRIEVELRQYDLLSKSAKALPATQELRERKKANPSARNYHEEIALSDLADLIRRVRSAPAGTPQRDPQAPQP